MKKETKYKKGDRFVIEIKDIQTDCSGNTAYVFSDIEYLYEAQLDELKQIK